MAARPKRTKRTDRTAQKAVMIWLPEELHRAFRVATVIRGTTMQAALVEAAATYVAAFGAEGAQEGHTNE